MAGIRARIVGVVVAYVALVALGQAILSLTPFELHPTCSTEGRQLDVLLELVWIIALVVQMRRQPSSGLWKLILLWVAVSQVWTLGYIPIEPVWLVELPGHLFGELWAAVFVHLIVAYPSGRLAHRRDRILVGIVYAVAIGFRFMALVVAPEPCWQICANPFRVLPSTELFDLVRYTAIALVPVLLIAANVELGRHWRLAGPGGRRALWPDARGITDLVRHGLRRLFRRRLPRRSGPVRHSLIQRHRARPGPCHPARDRVRCRPVSPRPGNVADLAVELSGGVPVGGLQPVLARALRDPVVPARVPGTDRRRPPGSRGRPDPAPGSIIAGHHERRAGRGGRRGLHRRPGGRGRGPGSSRRSDRSPAWPCTTSACRHWCAPSSMRCVSPGRDWWKPAMPNVAGSNATFTTAPSSD